MMRVFTFAILLAAAAAAAFLGVPRASAQSAASYPYCLQTDDGFECAYNTLQQCMESRHGTVDYCIPNNTYTGTRSRSPQ